MTSLCLYFQVHQPYRLRRYSFFEKGQQNDYFDNTLNRQLMERIAARSYLAANTVLLRSLDSHRGHFKVAFSITGTAIEQMRMYAPQALESFRALARTGLVEFLGETYYHSLAALYNRSECEAQVELHRQLMESEFSFSPRVFRNTELIYSDAIGGMISDMRYEAAVVEGVDSVLGWRSPYATYRIPGRSTRIILKSHVLSDDIAFRFSVSGEGGKPLTPEVFVRRVCERIEGDETVGLFMDYETFGEHYAESTGILDFLEALPKAVRQHSDLRFSLPHELAERPGASEELSYPQETSWADCSRDLSAWRGNRMQRSALEQIYGIAPTNPENLETWRKLQTSDHFYYMATKSGGDGIVHEYFNPYGSPYEAFINYSNVLRDFRGRV